MIKSSLTNYTRQAHSNNYTSGRPYGTIDRICLHHIANGWNPFPAESLGNLWANPNRAGSSNYGVFSDGRIGCYVGEEDTAWCNSNYYSNCKSISIEIENCNGNWEINDKAMQSVINLCADICQRYQWNTIDGHLTWHSKEADAKYPTSCPEHYILSKIDYIISEVNKKLKPIEYEMIEPISMITNIEPTSLWDLSFTNWDNVKSIKTYTKGTQIDNLVAKYHHPLGSTYLLTKYSIDNHIHNGFNEKDLISEEEYDNIIKEIAPNEPVEEQKEKDSINIPIEEKEPENGLNEVIDIEEKIEHNALIMLFIAIIRFIKKIFKGEKDE